jgi:carbon starvation protein CstA
MAVGLLVTLFISGDAKNIPEFAFKNLNPNAGKGIMAHLFPFLFITIACGAISGFHATQSPLMARCMKSEKEGRRIFYGAMILEGVIALIWAAVAMGHFTQNGDMSMLAKAGSAPVVVSKSSVELLGWVGGILAVFGVVACPITSGDTAFRSARLTIAEALKFDQGPIAKRFAISIPLFAIGGALVIFSTQSAASFGIIWRYFAWSNQTLATIGLWAASCYLAKVGKNFWIPCVPAAFMTVVVTAYFFSANECLGPIITKATGDAGATYTIAIIIGLVLSVAASCYFITQVAIRQKNTLKA